MANVSLSSCPHQFIYDPVASNKTNAVAQCDSHGCCLSCPHFNNFYGEGKIELLFTVLGCIGIIGFFLMIFLVLTFVVLPSTKNNPVIKKILIPFALSVLLFSAADFFSVDQKRSQCFSDVEQATIYNNKLCATQAFFELSGAYAVALWASVLIINLHMLSVWRSDFVMRNIKYFHIPVWIMVFLAAFVPMMTGEVASGGFCFISQKASPTFFYILSFIFPVCLLHLVTLAYMAKVSGRANRRQKEGRMSFSETQVLFVHIKHIIRVQWRAFVGAAFMLVVYVTDVFYFIFSTRKLVITQDTLWFPQWIDCLRQTNGDQDHCASYAQVTSFVLQVIVLTLNRSVGVVIFLIFAAKKSVFKEWIQLLTRKPREAMVRISSIPDVRESRMSSIAKRGRIHDPERGRSEGTKKSPGLHRVEYNPRNLEDRKDEQPRNKRTNRKPGNNRNRHETRETKTSSEPVTELVVNTALLPPLSIPAPLPDPTSTPSKFLLSPPKLHLPPPPPFDPPTSLSPRPRKVYPPVQYIGDSASQPSIMQAVNVTSTEVQYIDAQVSSSARKLDQIVEDVKGKDDYGTSSNASHFSMSQLSVVPSITVESIDVQVSSSAQKLDQIVEDVKGKDDYGTSSNASHFSISQLSVVPSITVESIDVQVSSPVQNDYDTTSNDSQPPIAQVSDNPSTEEEILPTIIKSTEEDP